MRVVWGSTAGRLEAWAELWRAERRRLTFVFKQVELHAEETHGLAEGVRRRALLLRTELQDLRRTREKLKRRRLDLLRSPLAAVRQASRFAIYEMTLQMEGGDEAHLTSQRRRWL